MSTAEPLHAYVFMVDQRAARYSLLRLGPDGWISLDTGTSHAIWGSPMDNRLTIRCTASATGTRVDGFVNGLALSDVDDRHGFSPFSNVGLFSESDYGTLDARFDDLLVTGR